MTGWDRGPRLRVGGGVGVGSGPVPRSRRRPWASARPVPCLSSGRGFGRVGQVADRVWPAVSGLPLDSTPAPRQRVVPAGTRGQTVRVDPADRRRRVGVVGASHRGQPGVGAPRWAPGRAVEAPSGSPAPRPLSRYRVGWPGVRGPGRGLVGGGCLTSLRPRRHHPGHCRTALIQTQTASVYRRWRTAGSDPPFRHRSASSRLSPRSRPPAASTGLVVKA